MYEVAGARSECLRRKSNPGHHLRLDIGVFQEHYKEPSLLWPTFHPGEPGSAAIGSMQSRFYLGAPVSIRRPGLGMRICGVRATPATEPLPC